MLTVTESARALLGEMLEQSTSPANVAIRLVTDGEGLSLALDEAGNGDVTYDHGGRPVLVVAEEISELMGNAKLDVMTTQEGPELTLVATEGEGE